MTIGKILPQLTLGVIISAAATFCLPVSAWVPAYSVVECKTILQKDFGGVGMKDGLTYLPLQFYKPNGAALQRIASDADARWFIDWGGKSGIKVLLCVFNYIEDWNWPEAVRSFKDNRTAFVNAVVAECGRLGFHGVDIDFEGPDVSAADRDAYHLFCAELAGKLHAQGKIVTYATFPAQYNAPNWDWWSAQLATVDGIGTMGYDWSSSDKDYTQQVQHASAAPWKLMIGMPGWLGTWQGLPATTQIDWVVNNGTVGVCIWDANLDSAWQTAAIWNKLRAIKQKAVPVIADRDPGASLGENGDGIRISNAPSRGLRIDITLHERGGVEARVYNLGGRAVVELCSDVQAAGTRALAWGGIESTGRRAADGAYTLLIKAGGNTVAKRFVLAR
jgi:hypothetical protein